MPGLDQDFQVGPWALGFLPQLPAPVPCTTDAFNELHQVAAEVPESAPSFQMSGSMGKQPVHNV